MLPKQHIKSGRHRANVINMTITETVAHDKWTINWDLDCELWIFDTASIMCPTTLHALVQTLKNKYHLFSYANKHPLWQLNTLRSRQMAAILQTKVIFSKPYFSNENRFILIQIPLQVVPNGPVNNKPVLV